ncbi:CHAP domain-containing protein [Paraconexibacter antarcticus]|uniref:CHAP domain-containing protein n=1 Tax=Paraconexibacter antarcticus TaxID=2949664 RepID=A0ABY5DRP6_9ACTN|nr:CHAP domain-containing protein [Paraconexibacter antarcticus]UTI64700.1 CHAP domain-containing protein [Paraconexibacter antarcticus]
MSVEAVMARITMIQQGLQPPTAPAGASAAPAWSADGTTQVPSAFAAMLGNATTGGDGATAGLTAPLAGGAALTAGSPLTAASIGGAVPVGAVAPGGDAGQRMIALAQQELAQGVAEQPPGSNDSPRIADYRTATAGSGVGPWCAYFVSWLAKQAGTPVGEAGQGFGSVDALHAWAQRTDRTTAAPAPGELIVWNEHIGLVTGVDPNGTIHTIEGNSSDRVSARTYGPDGGGALTYVKLG